MNLQVDSSSWRPPPLPGAHEGETIGAMVVEGDLESGCSSCSSEWIELRLVDAEGEAARGLPPVLRIPFNTGPVLIGRKNLTPGAPGLEESQVDGQFYELMISGRSDHDQPVSRWHTLLEASSNKFGELSLVGWDCWDHQKSHTTILRASIDMISDFDRGHGAKKTFMFHCDTLCICPFIFNCLTSEYDEFPLLKYKVHCPRLQRICKAEIKFLVKNKVCEWLLCDNAAQKHHCESFTGITMSFSKTGFGFPGRPPLRVVGLKGFREDLDNAMRIILDGISDLDAAEVGANHPGATGAFTSGFGVALPVDIGNNPRLHASLDNPVVGEIFKNEIAIYLSGDQTSLLRQLNDTIAFIPVNNFPWKPWKYEQISKKSSFYLGYFCMNFMNAYSAEQRVLNVGICEEVEARSLQIPPTDSRQQTAHTSIGHESSGS